jgi:hypothetical protein
MREVVLYHAHRIKTGSRESICFSTIGADMPSIEKLLREGLTKSGDAYEVRIMLPKKHRTTGPNSQGNHFNGHVQQICDDTGNDFADVKLYLKRRAFRKGLPYRQKPDGSVIYSLIDQEPMPISESDMDTIQCGWCIDEAHQLAAEMNIVLRED